MKVTVDIRQFFRFKSITSGLNANARQTNWFIMIVNHPITDYKPNSPQKDRLESLQKVFACEWRFFSGYLKTIPVALRCYRANETNLLWS